MKGYSMYAFLFSCVLYVLKVCLCKGNVAFYSLILFYFCNIKRNEVFVGDVLFDIMAGSIDDDKWNS